MKLKTEIFKSVTSLLMCALIIVPTLIINLHTLFHEHNEIEHHYHNKTTFCDDNISFCKCSDFTFMFFKSTLTKTIYKLSNQIFKSVDINSVERIYSNSFLRHKKGRSPPAKI